MAKNFNVKFEFFEFFFVKKPTTWEVLSAQQIKIDNSLIFPLQMLPIFSAYIHSTFSFHSQSCFRSALVTFNTKPARFRESDKNWRETFFSNLIKFLFSFFAISVCNFRFKIIEIRRVNSSRRKCKHLSTQIWAIFVWNCEKKNLKEKIFSRKKVFTSSYRKLASIEREEGKFERNVDGGRIKVRN